MNVCDRERGGEGREDTSAGDLGQGNFTSCQERERKKDRGGEASVRETRPVLDTPTECSISQKYSS